MELWQCTLGLSLTLIQYPILKACSSATRHYVNVCAYIINKIDITETETVAKLEQNVAQQNWLTLVF